jgi:hypothetical protein
MSERTSGRKQSSPPSLPESEFDLLELLDRLESLMEDMDELGVLTRAEAEALMNRVHAQLDELDDDSDA